MKENKKLRQYINTVIAENFLKNIFDLGDKVKSAESLDFDDDDVAKIFGTNDNYADEDEFEIDDDEDEFKDFRKPNYSPEFLLKSKLDRISRELKFELFNNVTINFNYTGNFELSRLPARLNNYAIAEGKRSASINFEMKGLDELKFTAPFPTFTLAEKEITRKYGMEVVDIRLLPFYLIENDKDIATFIYKALVDFIFFVFTKSNISKLLMHLYKENNDNTNIGGKIYNDFISDITNPKMDFRVRKAFVPNFNIKTKFSEKYVSMYTKERGKKPSLEVGKRAYKDGYKRTDAKKVYKYLNKTSPKTIFKNLQFEDEVRRAVVEKIKEYAIKKFNDELN